MPGAQPRLRPKEKPAQEAVGEGRETDLDHPGRSSTWKVVSEQLYNSVTDFDINYDMDVEN